LYPSLAPIPGAFCFIAPIFDSHMAKSSEKIIKWAILGAGKIARKFAQDFKQVKNATIIAVASRSRERAESFALEYQIPNLLSYEELYRSTEVDVVYIATPHNFHYEQALNCLQNKKAVLCEKPVTLNDGQFRSLIEEAQKNKVFLMEAMWTYFLPCIQKAKEWIVEGKIGRVKIIQADFGYKMDFNPYSRIYAPELAGGALLDLGVYPISFANFFAGPKPTSVVASGTLSTTGVDETTSILLQFNDISCVLYCSVVARTINKGYIFGETGYIELPEFHKAFSVRLYSNEHKLLESFEDGRNTWGYNYETQHVTDQLLSGASESSIASFQSSLTVQEIMTDVRRQIGLVYPGE
jgi:Predicted dehydrogenases and related proteins